MLYPNCTADLLHLRKRRYYCPHCGTVFQEKRSFLARYQRNTNRLHPKILYDYGCEYSTASIAKRNGVFAGTAVRVFDKVSHPLPNLPRALSIDEFKGNAGGRKFQVAKLEKFQKCFEIINKWQPYILRAFSLGYTNGFTESCNNRIKVLKRNCVNAGI